ncbi:MAG TPA: ribonuclease P protein component [Bryobacteraceae bacterium]|nr:ribonuclease P protein component [Bryobacteraceae bacterium]
MTNGPFVTPTASPAPGGARGASGPVHGEGFPKSRRLLQPSEFRQVYDQGLRIPTRHFVAFCWAAPGLEGPKVGFTTPRALGKAVKRNRMRRRLREIIRRQLSRLAPEWRIVWNLRRASLTATPADLAADVERIFERCGASPR